MTRFLWQARVYWEDTDGGGIVYYANYLRFLERARTEWLRSLGLSQRALALDPGVVFAVGSLEARYLRPARLDDLLIISCTAQYQGGASLSFEQQVWREQADGEALMQASVKVVCVDAQALKPRRLPAVIASLLESAAGQDAPRPTKG